MEETKNIHADGPFLWDWYGATLSESQMLDIEALFRRISDVVVYGRGRYGYAASWQALVDGVPLALCLVRGSGSAAGTVHLQVSGGRCPDLVPQIRSLSPFHRVSRADVRHDFRGGRQTFDRLLSITRDVLDGRPGPAIARRGVRSGDVLSPGGQTEYIGSPSSEIQVRIYEKGLHPDAAAAGIPSDVVRVEWQCRPGSAAKETFSALSPRQAVARSGWSAALAAAIDGCDLVSWSGGGAAGVGDLQSRVAWMIRQYGSTLRDLAAVHGDDWQLVGQMLGQRLGGEKFCLVTGKVLDAHEKWEYDRK